MGKQRENDMKDALAADADTPAEAAPASDATGAKAAAGTPKHRPNVVYLVLDDTGFASTGAFGNDVIRTPNIDRLASEGLRYNNFHTTAICSATRTSLLTGANHHKAGVNGLVDVATGNPNALGHVSNSYALASEILREHGYATFAVGKWHLTRNQTPAGPFDQWPLGRGFNRYYGSLAGMGDQLHPHLVQDNSYVSQPREPSEGYHFSEDIIDHAIDYVFTQHEAYPKQPFFLYVAFGATHTPFQAPAEYVERYRGKFHEGWDVLRRRWYENQRRLGVIPADAELTPRNEVVPAWDELSSDERVVVERYVEAFAGFLEHTDAQIGRLVEYLRSIGELDNTILVLLSDNGAASSGSRDGMFNSLRRSGAGHTLDTYVDEPSVAYGLEHLDEVGGEFSYPHYAAGWANAFNAPFPWFKALTFEGGTRDDLIVRWPSGIADPGAVRDQYLHVSDVTPTVLDALGLEKPEVVRGVPQEPFTGVSFASTFARADAPEVRREQYYEIFGNRALYKDGWKAVTNHLVNGLDYSRDVWELYHSATDYSEAHDVAAEHPEKLAELRAEFLLEAGRNDVFPLFRGHPSAGAHVEVRRAGEVTRRAVFEDVIHPFFVPTGVDAQLSDRPDVDLDKSDSNVQARVVLRTDDEGVIVAHGDRFGGFALFVQGGRLHYVYNANQVERHEIVSPEVLPVGEVEVGYQLRIDRSRSDDAPWSGIGAAEVTLFVNGEAVGSTRTETLYGQTLAKVELGANHYTAVSERYQSPFAFTGRLLRVELEQLGEREQLGLVDLADALGVD